MTNIKSLAFPGCIVSNQRNLNKTFMFANALRYRMSFTSLDPFYTQLAHSQYAE